MKKRAYHQTRYQVEINGKVVEETKNTQQWSDKKVLTALRSKYLTGAIHEFDYKVYKIIPSVLNTNNI